MSGKIAIVRAAHVNDYVSVLRRIGAPVDRDLSRSRLPSGIEENPDQYVKVELAMEWVAHCGRDLAPAELGFMGAQQASLASLKPAHQAAIITAPTGLRRLRAFASIAQSENNSLRPCLRREGSNIRIICDSPKLNHHPLYCFPEWLNVQGMISTVRSFAGAAWCPAEITFASCALPSEAALRAFPNTRILVGQPRSSILVQANLLAIATPQSRPDPDQAIRDIAAPDRQQPSWEFANLLQAVIRPYLNDGQPDLEFVAGLVGMSKRTLQRRLQKSGQSYSDLLRDARFSIAQDLLRDRNAKIIDVANAAGYENPQHFSRAFRKHTGLTPSVYRNTNSEIA